MTTPSTPGPSEQCLLNIEGVAALLHTIAEWVVIIGIGGYLLCEILSQGRLHTPLGAIGWVAFFAMTILKIVLWKIKSMRISRMH